eukprot:COSAG01_NODE_73526_length_243_cov_2.187500_1_plen_26_part_10
MIDYATEEQPYCNTNTSCPLAAIPLP